MTQFIEKKKFQNYRKKTRKKIWILFFEILSPLNVRVKNLVTSQTQQIFFLTTAKTFNFDFKILVRILFWRHSILIMFLDYFFKIFRYLKEFRCEQCPLFLQHKCTQHKPFTCFYWHFCNQRRRRPIRKRDGTFNYSPDVYCTKYDETTGVCPDGDEYVF